MLDAIEFNRPDRIPVFYHRMPAGLHVHGQKLLDLLRQHPPDNPIDLSALPAPPPGTLDAQGNYCESVIDEWGTRWEHRVFGIQGAPAGYPLQDWKADRFRFPALPSADPGAFAAEKQRLAALRGSYLTFGGWVLLFEKLCELQPMEQVLLDLASRDRDLLRFIDRLTEHYQAEVADLLAMGTDAIFFGDDWGGQTAPLVSPRLFVEVFRPRYQALFDLIHAAGGRAIFHSCGVMGELWRHVVELGADAVWPQAALFESEAGARELCEANRVAVFIHPDRQRLIPYGTPVEIEQAVRQYADRYHALGGGGIFYVEIENDAPYENARALIEAVARYR